MNINVVKVKPNAMLPEYHSEHAAAMDAHACLDQAMILQPMQRAVVPTGLAFELPIGTEMQVRARSGLSIKHGIAMVNGVGTIDADYRGELGILVINLGQESFTIEPNMRIAQLVVARHEKVVWNEVETLSETARSAGSYGSTGA
jgi:dUTP pyrophosphatase